MDVSGYTHSDSITVAAPPEQVYAIVSDVTRIGELSPVCAEGKWSEGAADAKAGGWFTGHNKIGEFTWDTQCRIDVADAGKEFTFTNCGATGDVELVRWGYRFEPDGDGTKVTETWQVLPAYPDFVRGDNPDMDVKARIDGMAQMARDGIKDTLANLKRVVEG